MTKNYVGKQEKNWFGFMSGGGRVQVEKCWVLRLVKVKQKSIGGLYLAI